jgi:hypothetical protein
MGCETMSKVRAQRHSRPDVHGLRTLPIVW